MTHRMTDRLTPEDEKRIRNESEEGFRVSVRSTESLLREIDALRAESQLLASESTAMRGENERLKAKYPVTHDTCPETISERGVYVGAYIQRGHCRQADLLAEIQTHHKEEALLRAEIATFRNASPSLCNCSQCLDLRKELKCD